jgi:hypothetical protein
MGKFRLRQDTWRFLEGRQGRKVFFFEKKKQKTFGSWLPLCGFFGALASSAGSLGWHAVCFDLLRRVALNGLLLFRSCQRVHIAFAPQDPQEI